MADPIYPDNAGEAALRQACAELERRIRAGEPYGAEDVFACCPALFTDPNAALDLLYLEYVTRTTRYQDAVKEDLYRRFPQWREALERQLLLHDWLDEPLDPEPAGQPLGPPAVPAGGPISPVEGEAGSCEILHEIGRGAMGVVYLGWQGKLNRVVAVKKILSRSRPTEKDVERFWAEAEAAARLHHPNIVHIYEVGQQGGIPYLVTEFVGGGTLEEKIAAGPTSPSEAALLLEKLAQAVHHAHQHGVVHRDLTPSNVLLTEGGEPKISDFGVAKVLFASGDGEAHSGELIGTPDYVAPEQAAGLTDEVGPAADVWGLGAILYELLTGQRPFHAHTVLETLDRVRFEAPLPLCRHRPDIPLDLEAICLKCLKKDPDQRYASAEALADELRRFLEGEPVRARRSGLVGRLLHWAAHRPFLAAVLSGVRPAGRNGSPDRRPGHGT